MPTPTLIIDLASSIHARSDSNSNDPDAVKDVILELTIQQYINVALASALIYHSLITIDQEVKFFWPNPLNSVSLIYFANRYVGLLGVISLIVADGLKESSMSCTFWSLMTMVSTLTFKPGKSMFWMSSLCNVMTFVLIDYILVIRVLALYYPDRRPAIFLKFLIGLEVAVSIFILVYGALYEETVAGELAEGIMFCGTLRTSPMLAIITLALPISFGFVLLSMTIYKAADYWRLSSSFKGFYLVRVLIMDQALYYACVVSCCTLIIVSDHVLQFRLAGSLLCTAGGPTLLCILGGYLLINLKEAGELGVNGGTDYRLRTVSGIEFAEEEGQTAENAEDVPSFENHSRA